MIKFKQGSITTQGGVTKDIIVKAATPNTLKDILIGGSMVLAGLTYLTVSAFKYGAKKFEDAEFRAMDELGLFEKVTTVKETL